MKFGKKRIILLCTLDGFANSKRANTLKAFLEEHGHVVEQIDTTFLSRYSAGKTSFRNKLPAWGIVPLLLYCCEAVYFLCNRYFPSRKTWYVYYALVAQLHLRRLMLHRRLKAKRCDLLICASLLDSALLLSGLPYPILYDAQSPWSDELYFGGNLSESQYRRFKQKEIAIYEHADFLSFHWESLKRYVQKHYPYTKDNALVLNIGTEQKAKRATYAEKPKIVFVGLLSGDWVNLPLLSALSKLYPIDVYGWPEPDPRYGLRFKGNPCIDRVADYQFGLITISKDPLRRAAISAKHLEYLSYGLPVLVPDWRPSAAAIAGTVLYNEQTFVDVVERYSKKEAWMALHRLALKQATQLHWKKSLQPLIDQVLSGQPPKKNSA